jgi:MATE family multidrug resistance protein
MFPVVLKISGVAVGSGWQALVAYVNLVCYYLIGLPVGCVLGFKTSLGVAVSLKYFSLTNYI